MARRTRTELRGEQSREEILQSAETLMATRGYRATSMSDLIRESGASSSSIYWHFSSKAGVLAAVMERGAASFFAGVEKAAPPVDHENPRLALEYVLQHSVNAVLENPGFLTLYFNFLLHFEEEPAVATQIAAVRSEALAAVRSHLQASYATYGEERAARIAARVAPLAIATFDGIFMGLESPERPDTTQIVADAATALHALAESIS